MASGAPPPKKCLTCDDEANEDYACALCDQTKPTCYDCDATRWAGTEFGEFSICAQCVDLFGGDQHTLYDLILFDDDGKYSELCVQLLNTLLKVRRGDLMTRKNKGNRFTVT